MDELIKNILNEPIGGEGGIVSNVYFGDCMDFMAEIPDNYFDMVLTDPPYGIGKDWLKRKRGVVFQETTYDNSQRPNGRFFEELKRISKHQIIFGYNYFTEYLGSTNHLIVWDKISANNLKFSYSRCEIAYTDIPRPCTIARIPWDGARKGNETGIKKIHPHQRPVALYEWCLQNYACKNYKIFDACVGSGSTRIAAHKLGHYYVGCEIDPFYYQKQEERFTDYLKKYVVI